mgnify:CR=1 FL=1
MSGQITGNIVKTKYLSSTDGAVNWTLPTVDGAAGTTLSTNGALGLTFSTPNIGGVSLSGNLKTGLISGGVLGVSEPADIYFSISAGTAVIVNDLDRENIVVTKITWTEKTGLTTPYREDDPGTWVGLDINGDVLTKASDFTAHEMQHNIRLGRLSHWDRSVISTASEFPLYFNINSVFARVSVSFGTTNTYGNIYSASATFGLSLNKSAGTCLRIGSNATTDPECPDITALAQKDTDTLRLVHRDTGTGTTLVGDQTTIDPEHYDLNGTLTAITSGCSIQTIIIFPFNTAWRTFVLYGQEKYANIGAGKEALPGYQPEIRDDIFGGNIRGFLLVQESCTDLAADIASGAAVFRNGFIHGTIS